MWLQIDVIGATDHAVIHSDVRKLAAVFSPFCPELMLNPLLPPADLDSVRIKKLTKMRHLMRTLR